MTAPAAPGNVQTTALPTGTQVSWDRPLYDGGGVSLTYNVYRGSTLVASGLSATSYLDPAGATAAAASTYSVTAVNEVGESWHSGGHCVDPTLVPPEVDPWTCVGFAIDVVLWVVGQIT